MYIVVGSTALEYFGCSRREPLDIDLWVSEGDDGLYADDVHCLPKEILCLVPTENGRATPDAIYTIKCSHFCWDIKWEKTKLDILHLKHLDCELIPELYTALREHWKHIHGDKSFLSLTKSKADFFNDHVKYVYDHDYLHKLVAHPEQPTYLCCLRDGEDVLIDKAKFDRLPFEKQVSMFREEITVIAIERWLVKDEGVLDVTGWMVAYSKSLKKTVTNLTKNWANDFITQNLDQFVKPEYEYFKHALTTLNHEEDDMKELMDKLQELFPESYERNIDGLIYGLAEGELGEHLEGDLHYADLGWKDYKAKLEAIEAENGYEQLHQEGGGEGGTEYCEAVFSFGGKIYKCDYCYSSHEGYDSSGIADTLREVKAVEKTVTVWE